MNVNGESEGYPLNYKILGMSFRTPIKAKGPASGSLTMIWMLRDTRAPDAEEYRAIPMRLSTTGLSFDNSMDPSLLTNYLCLPLKS